MGRRARLVAEPMRVWWLMRVDDMVRRRGLVGMRDMSWMVGLERRLCGEI